MTKRPNLCPCKSGKSYTLCCGRFHKGKIHAPTAELLMRSRFSAYALNIPQYIYRTWDESTRPSLQSLRESQYQTYKDLVICNTSLGNVNDIEGKVEFIATIESDNNTFTHQEISRFTKVKNRWVYVDAIQEDFENK